MNEKYIIIGFGLTIAGVVIAIKEWKQFTKELKSEETTTLVLLKGFVDTFFLGGLGVAGIIFLLVGVAFIGTGFKWW